MYYRDTERLMLSILLALVLYGVLFLVLRGTSWSAEPEFQDRLGPVEVTLEPLPERTEPAREPEPEPEPVELPEEKPAPQAPPAVSRPAPVSAPRAPARTAVPGSGGSIAENAPAPRSEGEGVALPVETVEEGVIEEEIPLDIRGESRVIYAEDTPDSAEDQPGSDLPVTEDPNRIDFELDDEGLDQALERLPATEGVTGKGTAASGTGDEGGAQQPEHISIGFITPGADRKLLSWRDPDLSSELVSRLPPSSVVVVRFTITPEGYVLDLTVDRSSGAADIDSAVMKAMRAWRFEKADNPDIRVEATVRYVIQTR